MTDTPRWPMPWIRASLELAVLGSLTTGPLHGYGIAQALAAQGFGLLKGGSLYPVLNRLEEARSVEAAWVDGTGGPGKREYRLTATGRERLREELAQWRQLTDTLSEMAQSEMAQNEMAQNEMAQSEMAQSEMAQSEMGSTSTGETG